MNLNKYQFDMFNKIKKIKGNFLTLEKTGLTMMEALNFYQSFKDIKEEHILNRDKSILVKFKTISDIMILMLYDNSFDIVKDENNFNDIDILISQYEKEELIKELEVMINGNNKKRGRL